MHQLYNHCSIPSIGFGTWKILDADEAARSMDAALSCGYRLIDTASVYENEKMIGDAIAGLPISRDALFLSGKVWNADRGYEKTLSAFRKSCKNLGTDYLDCYLIHWPASPFFSEDWEAENADTWRALEHLYEAGDVRSIGVCNYAPVHLDALAKTAVHKPMIDQIEFHPGCFPADIYAYCAKEGIVLEAWSPLGNGSLLTHPSLLSLAEKYKCSPAKICLRWCGQNNAIPLPKSVTPGRIAENIEPAGFSLSTEEMELLKQISP